MEKLIDPLSRAEEALRLGALYLAGKELRSVPARRLPRKHLWRFANLCRRAQLPELGIGALRRFVRPDRPVRDAPTPPEIGEYAACLISLGAVSEGMDLLTEVDGREYPESLLFRSFGFITEWNYAAAIRPLQDYLRVASSDYQRLVAHVNLSASLISEGLYADARRALDETQKGAQELRAHRLGQNCQELRAQLLVGSGEFQEAERYLDSAAWESAESSSLDQLLIRKWKAICLLNRIGGDLRSASRRLDGVRADAIGNRYWEIVRDCDYHLATRTRDPELWNRLYFGTPFAGYRRRLMREAPPEWHMASEYLWHLGPRSAATFDLQELAEDGIRLPVKPGMLLARLLDLTTSDFYAPFRPGSLFSALFPGEHFNPSSSVARVHILMHRMRKILRPTSLQIRWEGGSYRLASPKGVRVRIRAEPRFPSRMWALMRQLQERLGGRTFSARDASRALGISLRSANRVIGFGRAQSLLNRQGRGKSVRYLIPEQALGRS